MNRRPETVDIKARGCQSPKADEKQFNAPARPIADGPNSAHAFDIVPLQPRKGSLDAMCRVCKGRGQWNTEIELVSFRCKRTACDRCHGAGWVETGSDPIGLPDIEIAPGGYPRWTLRFEPADEATQIDPETPGLSQT